MADAQVIDVTLDPRTLLALESTGRALDAARESVERAEAELAAARAELVANAAKLEQLLRRHAAAT